MKNKIIVLNARKLLFALIVICTITVTCICGDELVSDIIETASNNRLLPIYSVDRVDKMVSITFDCAWSQSQ